MPLANLIHKVKSQQLFKNIYKRNLNVKCVCYSAFETSCTIIYTINFQLVYQNLILEKSHKLTRIDFYGLIMYALPY